MNKIIVGVDGSPRQSAVLATAVHLAQAFGGRITLLRVLSIPMELPARAYAIPPDQLGDLLIGDARTELDEAARVVPTTVLGETKAVLGVPWRALVEEAKQQQADLIVVGSHGYGGLDRLLGTTAAKVVDHATCSVLVVRALI